MKHILFLASASFVLSACTTMLNPPQASKRKIEINGSEVQSLVQFSDTRTETHFAHQRPAKEIIEIVRDDAGRIISQTKRYESNPDGYVSGDFVSCFSPMPDTATQVAATLKGSASLANALSGNQSRASSGSRSNSFTRDTISRENSLSRNNEASNAFDGSSNQSGNVEGSFSTTVIELDGRTEMVVATREVFQAVCLAYANGMITPNQAQSLIHKALGVMVTLADADNKEAAAKKDEAEAKKKEAAAKEKTAEAKKAEAEAALYKAQAKQIQATRLSLSQNLYSNFVNSAGTFDSTRWNKFLNLPETTSQLGGYKLAKVKAFATSEIVKKLSGPLYEDDLPELIIIAEQMP